LEDPYEIYNEIMNKKLQLPAFVKDESVKDLIQQLLNKTPELRGGGSFTALKTHEYFDKFDWVN
jgi:cGMP-dependent protein kinase